MFKITLKSIYLSKHLVDESTKKKRLNAHLSVTRVPAQRPEHLLQLVQIRGGLGGLLEQRVHRGLLLVGGGVGGRGLWRHGVAFAGVQTGQ